MMLANMTANVERKVHNQFVIANIEPDADHDKVIALIINEICNLEGRDITMWFNGEYHHFRVRIKLELEWK